MYCPRCTEERGPKKRFCVACGGPLEARTREAVERDVQQHVFLLDAIERWEKSGDLPAKFATRLAEPYKARLERLEGAFDEALPRVEPAPRVEAEPSRFAEVVAEPLVRVEPPPSQLQAAVVQAPPEPLPVPPAPQPRNEVAVGRAAAPEAEAIDAAADAVALGSSLIEGPLALAELRAPAPSALEKLVERESTWSKVWKPFLYDNAVWFVGAFCIVSGSLYVASQAYAHVGDTARSLIVFGMMLAYAAGFGAAGWLLGERKQLLSAGRILGLISAAIAPVALVTLEPLRLHAPFAFAGAGVLGVAGASWLLKLACDRFDERMSLRVAATGLALLGWELLVPAAAAEAGLCAAVPLAALFSATGMLRRREPPMERAAQAFGALALLYLTGFDLARIAFFAPSAPGLALYGPVVAALGWIALRADRARLGDLEDRPRVPATTLTALALLGVGALASLVAEASAAAAAMIATLAFADAARTYKRAPFVAVAAVLGLFAYYLSPDLIPHGIEALLATARHALGYAPNASLPVAYAGVSTVPYLLLLGVLARRARSRGLAWVYRPLAWTGAALTVLLTLVAHSSLEVRPGLWSSVALLGLLAAALWLADHAAAGYLFGYVVALLGYDLSRKFDPQADAVAVFVMAAAVGLLVIARLAPARQRDGLIGEALLLALAAPFVAFASPPGLEQLELVAAGAVLVVLAFETRSRLPAFAAALALVGAGLTWEAMPSLPALALALGCVLAAGLSWQPARPCDPGAKPFGLALPLRARGYALLRDPLALLGGALALIEIFAPAGDALDAFTSPGGDAVARLAIGAVVALLLSRRYAFGWGGFAAVLLGALACSRSAPALAVFGLASAAAAVVFELWPAASRAVLRSEGLAATSPYAVCAILAPLAVANGSHPGWLVASAAGYLLLMRWRDLAWVWLPLAGASLWWAMGPSHPQPGLVPGALALGFALLGLVADRRPAVVELGLGGSAKPIAWTSAALVLAATMLGATESFAFGGHAGSSQAWLAATFAVYALAWLLLAQQTRHAVPLFVGLAFAMAVADAWWFDAFGQIHLAEALALAVLANGVRVFGTLAEPLFGPRPARTSGYALALLALLSLGLGALGLLDAHNLWTQLLPYAAALVVFLSARALGWSVLQPVALGLALFDLYDHHGHAARVAVYLGAAGALIAAVSARRWPAALTLIFLDRAPDRGRATLLRGSMLAAMLLALCGAAWLAMDLQHAAFALAVAGIAALLALAVFAAPSPAWWTAASLVALAGALEHSENRDFIAAFAVLNGILAAAGLLRAEPFARALKALFAATDAQGRAPRSLRPYASALSLTGAFVLIAPALALLGALSDRIELRHPVDPGAAQVALLVVPTALHLLWRRRGLWSLALVFTLLVLPVAYLAPASLRAVLVAACALPFALLAWKLPARGLARLLTRVALCMPPRRRTHAASLAFGFTVTMACCAALATGFELGAWQTPATAAILTVALGIASLRQRSGRVLALALLPGTAHLGLAWLGIQLSTGRPQVAILGGWALASALLAVAAERYARSEKSRRDVLGAAHLYFALGVFELGGAIALMPGMRSSELLFAGLAAALLGTFATLRALETGHEIYAYLAQGAALALYLLVRVQTDWLGAHGDRDALSSVLLGFAFLGLHALARRAEAEVFERPTRAMTYLLPLVGLVFLPQLSLSQGALYGLGLALHFAAVSATLGGSKLAATLSAVALNTALALTWIGRGIHDPQFYAIPFGATLLTFARLFRDELSEDARFWMRSAGILSVYIASMASTFLYANPLYVLVCAAVCVGGVLLGIVLRVRSYVYLGSAALIVDVLGNMVRYSLHERLLLGLMLTLMGFVLVGGWVFFLSKREELLRRYAAIQALMREWE